MGYDSKYKHGLSWLDDDAEDDPCSRKILTALYAAIYDQESSPDVVRWLLKAYSSQWEIDNSDNDDDAPNVVEYSGDEAYQYLRLRWADVYKRHLDRYEIPNDKESIQESETFEWPSSLPSDYPIRRGILKSIGARMGAADAWTTKCLRDAALQDQAATKERDDGASETEI